MTDRTQSHRALATFAISAICAFFAFWVIGTSFAICMMDICHLCQTPPPAFLPKKSASECHFNLLW